MAGGQPPLPCPHCLSSRTPRGLSSVRSSTGVWAGHGASQRRQLSPAAAHPAAAAGRTRMRTNTSSG
eukprot:8280756-Pyramimonas_sp.AAC.1